MGFTYSVDDHSPHNFGLAFNSRPLRRARFFLVLFRLRACAATGVLILLATVLASTIASAQQKTPDQTPSDLADLSLEQLMNVNIYTASKRWQKIVDAPASISIVSADEIQRYGYRTLAEILRSMRGVYLGYDRNYSYIGVRGFSRPGDYNTRVLLLVDGHRINDNVFDQAYLGTEFPIDVDLIERVEFIRGPSSSLYGGSAFFGVINVITKRARNNSGVSASFEAASFGTYKGRISYGANLKNGLEMLLSASFYNSAGQRLFYPEFNTPETNNGFADNGDYDESHSFLANILYRDFRLQAVHSSREKGIPTAAFGTVFNDPRTRTIDEDSYADLQYQHTFRNGLDVIGRLFYDWYNYDGTYIVDYAGTGVPPYVENKDFTRGRWWGVELNASRSLQKHRLTVGIEYRDNPRQDQGNYDADPYFIYLDDRRSSKIWALYAEDEFRIRDNLIINAGLRYDHYDTFGGTANPRVALIYKPDEHGAVKLLYGQAFRAPNYFEMFYGASITNKPNPALEPERIKTTELIVERYSKHFRFALSGFYNEIDALISQRLDPVDGRIQFQNHNGVSGKGIEGAVEGKFSNGIEGRLAYTLQSSFSQHTGDSLTNSPKHLAKLNVSIPLAKGKLFASLEGLYTSERRTIADSNVSGSFISNATIISKSLFKGFDVSASVYNLFDVRYWDPGAEEHRQDSIQQDGRSFRLKLTYTFDRGK
jgi:outer membrane receptor for ferrienterochelin and colicins